MPPSYKRQRVSRPVEEITFNEAARAEWLTGFSKRKAARVKAAQEAAAQREKDEKREARAELRKQRKEDLERHIADVKIAMRQMNPDAASSSDEGEDDEGSDDEWQGIQDRQQQDDGVVDREDEYVDEDKYTTVTVETVDVGREGFTKRKAPGDESSDGEDEGEDSDGTEGGGDEDGKTAAAAGNTKDGKRVWTKEKPKSDKPKKRKKKFRYESKTERKMTQAKDRAKKKAQGDKFKARRKG